MKPFFLVGALGVSGAAWAGDEPAADAPAVDDADGCEPGYDSMTRPEGLSLCVATHPTSIGLVDPGPALPTTVLGPAIGWTADSEWFLGVPDSKDRALPYGHTVGGFVALAPGLDHAVRYDGQALSVRLDGMTLMSPTAPAALPRLPTRLR